MKKNVIPVLSLIFLTSVGMVYAMDKTLEPTVLPTHVIDAQQLLEKIESQARIIENQRLQLNEQAAQNSSKHREILNLERMLEAARSENKDELWRVGSYQYEVGVRWGRTEALILGGIACGALVMVANYGYGRDICALLQLQ